MGFEVTARMTGLDGLLQRIREMPDRVQKRVLRPTVAKAGRVVAKAMKTDTPVEKGAKGSLARARSGQMKRSMGSRVRVYRKGNVVVAIIGPRTGFKINVGTRVRGKNKGKPVFHNPTQIAAQVERGHGGPHPAEARKFMQNALQSSRGQVQEILQREMLAGIEREAAR